ncbi:MAG TPA: diacylglycerol kinase family protein [Actinomycetota bacterium]|nr:diacylglycerol kinase family protein [Actinomycetota bacterium]
MSRRFLVVSNAHSGSNDQELETAVVEALGSVEILRLSESPDLGKEVKRAVGEDRVVVVVGGDGTVNATVQHLGGGTLGVIPGGTRNHFARDLGVPELDQALEAIRSGTERRADLGRVNGKAFVNNAGLGLYPELVEERERKEDAIGRWPAMLAGAFRLWRGADPVVATVSRDGDRRAVSAWVVFVGNNRFDTAPGRLGRRQRLDEGVLDVRVITAKRHPSSFTPAWRLLRKASWQPDGQVRASARSLEVDVSGPPRLFSVDGETAGPERRLSFEIEPGALNVLAPG